MIIFCSDVHLDLNDSKAKYFKDFLRNLPKKTQALFILGDLFESWWGDDHNYAYYKEWEKIFKNLTIPLYFVPGNRDFLCGTFFFRRTNIIPLKSGSIISYGNEKIAVFHGDEKALIDPGYHKVRPLLRSSVIRNIFFLLPESVRQFIALKLRTYSSKPLTLEIDDAILIEESLLKPTVIIHGHLHFERKRTLEKCRLYQLGCWEENQGSWLCVHRNGTIHYNQQINEPLIQ